MPLLAFDGFPEGCALQFVAWLEATKGGFASFCVLDMSTSVHEAIGSSSGNCSQQDQSKSEPVSPRYEAVPGLSGGHEEVDELSAKSRNSLRSTGS